MAASVQRPTLQPKRSSWNVANGALPKSLLSGFMGGVYAFSALVSVIYGISVIQYGFYISLGTDGPLGPSAPMTGWSAWNDEILVPLAGRAFMEGPGSTTLNQKERYGKYFYFMTPHTIAGGVMVFCSIIQMNPRFRVDGKQKYHRISGRVYVIAQVFSLYGSLGFLVTHTFPHVWPEEESCSFGGVYGGSIFVVTLWLYWGLTAGTLTMALYHIARGEVQNHRSWMSLNYGAVMGSPMLRLAWGVFGALTTYRMDEINTASVMTYISSYAFLACCYSSFANRRDPTALSDGTVSLISKPMLAAGIFGAAMLANQCVLRFWAGSVDLHSALPSSKEAAESDAYQQALVMRAGIAGLLAAVAHVLSWSVLLILGAYAIRKAITPPWELSEGVAVGYAMAALVAGITSSSWFGPLSFSFFLQHPAPEDSHFYKALPAVTWETKVLFLWLKTAIFVLAVRTGDTSRTIEWLFFSYGEALFYPIMFLLVWVFQLLLPAYADFQDAYWHAMSVATLAGVFTMYVLSIYVFDAEQSLGISAVRNGLFRWRAGRGAKGEPLLREPR